MVKIYSDKIIEMIRIREQKISELYRKKSEIEKLIKSIKKEKNNILYNSCYFNCDDSFRAILYLVCLIEKEEYSIRKIPAILYEPRYFPGTGVLDVEYNYYFIILTKNDNKNIKNILDDKFGNFRGQRSDFKSLFAPNDDYVIIACLEEGFDNRICYMVGSDYNLGGDISYICDDRYKYIVDYMDTVVDYKLDKSNLEVTFDEMKALADKFAINYSNGNSIKKKSRMKQKY